MKDYLTTILWDTILSLITKKFGTKLNDSEREAKAEEVIAALRDHYSFTVDMTQAIINKKGINDFTTANIGGQSVFKLVKTGMFGKFKVCYYITRSKDVIDGAYLEKVYDELNRQANGENVFNAPDYVNK
jgi:hypothetical protein